MIFITAMIIQLKIIRLLVMKVMTLAIRMATTISGDTN